MKKRWLSILLCLLLCVSLLPVGSLAAEEAQGEDAETVTASVSASESETEAVYETASYEAATYLALSLEARFPDAAFRSYVSANFDTNGDGALSDEECAAVIYVSCYNKGIHSLEGIRYFPNLKGLSCAKNSLTTLDVSHNRHLQKLNCSDNQLTQLDLSYNQELTELVCTNNEIATLDICATQLFQNSIISYIGHQGVAGLSTITVYMSPVQSNNFLHDPAYKGTDTQNQNVVIATGRGEWPDAVFHTYLYENFDTNGDGYLSTAERESVTKIDVSGKQIATLEGISLFPNLIQLDCSNNKLLSLNLSQNKKLQLLDCSYNELTELTVSHMANLQELRCSGNAISALDLTENYALELLYCEENRLTELNLDNNTNLSALDCSYNAISKLDLSHTQVSTESDHYTIIGGQEKGITIFVGMTQAQVTVFKERFSTLLANDSVNYGDYRFPDPTFRDELLRLYDTDKDRFLSPQECDGVGKLSVREIGITSLEGIQYFPYLYNLDCSKNELTVLDVSENTKLTVLTCNGNRLKSLDVSKNTALTELVFSGNQLTELDVTKNLRLETLIGFNNQLGALNLSRNAKLSCLDISDNKLTTLDVSANTALKTFDCSNNSISNLNLSANAALSIFRCYGNKLSMLDIRTTKIYTQNSASYLGQQQNGSVMVLMTADQYSVFMDQYADSSYNSGVYIGFEDSRFPDNAFLAYLLSHFDTDKNGILSTEECEAVTQIVVNNLNIDSLQGLEYFPNLSVLSCGGNNLTTLDVSKNAKLTDLICSNNKLTALDVSANPQLNWLGCSKNALTNLDVSHNTLLKNLYCNNNYLTEIDVSGNTLLNDFQIDNNLLTTLSLPNHPNLYQLVCDNNNLTELDFSNCTGLHDLSCCGNRLTSLDITNTLVNTEKYASKYGSQQNDRCITVYMTDLQKTVHDASSYPENKNVTVVISDSRFPDLIFRNYVYDTCDGNHDGVVTDAELLEITELRVSGLGISSLKGIEYFKNLESLSCDKNNLTELNLSANQKLSVLSCSGNALTELDVSICPSLVMLSCSSNKLTGLDLSGNAKLTTLSCADNDITEIVFNPDMKLGALACDGNRLTELDIREVFQMNQYLYLGNQQNNATILVKMTPAQIAWFNQNDAGQYRNRNVNADTGVSGDVNNDGVFSLLDVSVLYRYISGQAGNLFINRIAADVNGDGAIRLPDVSLLFKRYEAQTYRVVMTSYGTGEVAVIRVVRELTGLDLKTAKALVDGVSDGPVVITDGLTAAQAEDAAQKLTAAGASVYIEPQP